MNEADVDKIINAADKICDGIEVYLINSNDIEVEQREKQISSVFEHSGKSVLIRVLSDNRIGVSGTSDPMRWKDCLKAAVSSAKLSEPVGDSFSFAEKKSIPAGDDPYDDNIEVSADFASEYLNRMNDGAEKYPNSRIVTGSVSVFEGSSLLANSNGVHLERKMTELSLGMDTICAMSTGYEYDSSPFISRINPEKIGELSAYWSSASENGVRIESKKYDLVLSESVVYSLILGLFSSAVSGHNVLHGKSVYAGKLFEEVCSSDLSVSDRPTDKEGSVWRRFDCEGNATHDIDIIDKGVLKSFLYDSVTASKANAQTTSSAHKAGDGSTYISPHCLRISAKTDNIMDKPCLFVKDAIGVHTANSLTGDFSVETANAFLCENGEFVKPVKKAMISGNVFDILKSSITISKETKTFDGAVVPRIRIPDMQVI